ncbi:cation:proton antiporter [Variovorax sp. J22R133]|uniref:cation:proton antiporter n=1 Tax=Variovorax brevis TaxID=3053503 RepID=UPI002577C854|nr:cation:proton antiporter [Variovorax sp. J22R133]MDM0113677.1 cation:proton antiporter [Variovorax sp. J22R133]
MSHLPVFWVIVASVVAPLLGEIPLGFAVPVVVLEVLLGIVIGPHVLGLAHFDGFIATMFTFGMATTLFMAGIELDFGSIKGRPLSLAIGGWVLSVVLGVVLVALMHSVPSVNAPLMVALALCTTGLGVLVPIFRDGGQLDTPFGRFAMAAGTLGELAPIVAMSLLLSRQYSGLQEAGFMLIFLCIIVAATIVGIRARPPKLLAMFGRHMHRSTQMPVRVSLLILAALLLIASKFGFESIIGAFAAGMVLGQATRGPAGAHLREKIETVSFAWFYPFFFVGTGIKFDIAALGRDGTAMLLVPAFAVLFLIVRGAPALLYRGQLDRGHMLPFALSCAVPSLSIIVVITEIGTRAGTMTSDVAAALIGAALLCVLLFPTIAGALLAQRSRGDQTVDQR